MLLRLPGASYSYSNVPPWFSSLTSSPAALRVKMSTASHSGSRSSSSALRHSARVARRISSDSVS
ncbi:hypothetical protein ACI00D_004397 [Cronobacter dublinensis]|nr:hypothetical protein [Cronobacter dublinensis]